MVKVSIIVPVYEVPLDYLRGCFNSLLAQTMNDCEFIVVSDGAPEAECSVCDKYASKDFRFKFFHKEHSGVSAARNYGIEKAEGEFITFVDSDDTVEREFCRKLYTFAKQNGSEVVLFDYSPTGNQFQKKSYANHAIKNISNYNIQEIKHQIISLTEDRFVGAVSTICKITKRSLIMENKIRFPLNIPIAEDRPFSYEIFSKAKKISYLNEFLYNYTANINSVTNQPKHQQFPILSSHLIEIFHKHPEDTKLISTTYINIFFRSWSRYYFNKNSANDLTKNIKELSSIVKSKQFQYFANQADNSNFSNLVKFELFLFKHRILIPLWIHGFKNFILPQQHYK